MCEQFLCSSAIPAFVHPLHLTFPEHGHRFISLQGSPRGLHPKEAHPRLHQPCNKHTYYTKG